MALKLWLIIKISLALSSWTNAFHVNQELPCDFIDSINITGGIVDANHNILFNGIEFTSDQYATVNYIIDGTDRILVKMHERGCPCMSKPCIRLCCPYGSFVESMEYGEDIECRKNEAAKQIKSEIIDENNKTSVINLNEHFGFADKACHRHFIADDFKLHKVYGQWFRLIIFRLQLHLVNLIEWFLLIIQTGDVSLDFGIVNNREYCISVSEDESNKINMNAMVCMDPAGEQPDPKYTILAYGE